MYINVTDIRNTRCDAHTILLELLDRKPPAAIPPPPAGVEVEGDAAAPAPGAIRFLDRDVMGKGIR